MGLEQLRIPGFDPFCAVPKATMAAGRPGQFVSLSRRFPPRRVERLLPPQSGRGGRGCRWLFDLATHQGLG